MMKKIYPKSALPVVSHRWSSISAVAQTETSGVAHTRTGAPQEGELTGSHTTRVISHTQLPVAEHVPYAIHGHAHTDGAVFERSHSTLPSLTPAQRTLFAQLGAELSEDLTAEEEAVLRELKFHKSAVPADTWLFTDPKNEPDNIAVYALGKQLQYEGFLYIKDVVTTPVYAQCVEIAKGGFDSPEVPDMQMLAGHEFSMNREQAKDHTEFIAEQHALRPGSDGIQRDGLQEMQRRLEHAPNGLNMVVIAGMSGVNELITANPDLMRQRVESITVVCEGEPVKDKEGVVQPDARSYDNKDDLDTARSFYRRVQKQGIPLRIVTRAAAWRTAVSSAFYEGVAKSDNPTNYCQHGLRKSALKALWEGIQAGLLPELNGAWFARTFMPGAKTAPESEENKALSFDKIWPEVTRLNLYDPLALLASLPAAARILFEPTAIHTEGAGVVELIGQDDVKNPEKARLLMSALAKSALATSVK
ncbi:type III secretion system effector XopQ [Erwinia psidii]|uniref:type III secretion system effector XopQ n=1 Tax=Erwinia psidii TaxID=69224 RepID=UPI001F31B83C|nr:type III secretion system effector XopQ [Erwinia psidii]